MSIRIPTQDVKNLQLIETALTGPVRANRLSIAVGRLEVSLCAQTSLHEQHSKETQTFSVLLGPVLDRRQFIQAIATASIGSVTSVTSEPGEAASTWSLRSVEADWDDESSQVELRIEASVEARGAGSKILIEAIAFQVIILAEATKFL